MHDGPITFPNWKEVLAQATLSPQIKAAYLLEILAFLKHCRTSRTPATTALAKQYLEWREKQTSGPAREALRWFYREGRRMARTDSLVQSPKLAGSDPTGPIVPAPPAGILPPPAHKSRQMEPPPAATDLGTQPWERDLIKAIRERNFLWRTEQTYREWAVRFARFIAPRSPYAASGEDVAAFLSALAVQGRASPSAQKQALNALVFLMQEALHRDLGKMEFQRAYPRQRLPTVLSPGECQSIFVQLEGTPRLMVELAYGSGLRLMELLDQARHPARFPPLIRHPPVGSRDGHPHRPRIAGPRQRRDHPDLHPRHAETRPRRAVAPGPMTPMLVIY
jgi:hypothetical protein